MTNDRSRTHQLTDWQTSRVCTVWSVNCLHFALFFLLEDQQINRLAGNSIAIPVVGAILAVLLASTRLPLDTSPEPGSDYQERLDLTPLPPQWIGAKCIAPAAGPFDSLFTEPARKKSGDAGTLKQKRQVRQSSMDHFVKKQKIWRSDDVELIIQPSALNDMCLAGSCDCCCCPVGDWKITCVEIQMFGKICSVLVHDDFKKPRVPEVVWSWWGGIGFCWFQISHLRSFESFLKQCWKIVIFPFFGTSGKHWIPTLFRYRARFRYIFNFPQFSRKSNFLGFFNFQWFWHFCTLG